MFSRKLSYIFLFVFFVWMYSYFFIIFLFFIAYCAPHTTSSLSNSLIMLQFLAVTLANCTSLIVLFLFFFEIFNFSVLFYIIKNQVVQNTVQIWNWFLVDLVILFFCLFFVYSSSCKNVFFYVEINFFVSWFFYFCLFIFWCKLYFAFIFFFFSQIYLKIHKTVIVFNFTIYIFFISTWITYFTILNVFISLITKFCFIHTFFAFLILLSMHDWISIFFINSCINNIFLLIFLFKSFILYLWFFFHILYSICIIFFFFLSASFNSGFMCYAHNLIIFLILFICSSAPLTSIYFLKMFYFIFFVIDLSQVFLYNICCLYVFFYYNYLVLFFNSHRHFFLFFRYKSMKIFFVCLYISVNLDFIYLLEVC
uniref:NADH dehydrogenase subunit 2 n=1 Tax=Blastocrithidia nonstop TaxID=2592485 RepID=A0AAT9UQZ0_9TRYP